MDMINDGFRFNELDALFGGNLEHQGPGRFANLALE
jgi:hypothetical protein